MTAPLETEIRTERLLLRPLFESDAPAIQHLAGDARVARFTSNIPHPYPYGAAESFIAETLEKQARGEVRTFAITLADEPRALIGMIGLIDRDDSVEMGYWLGVPNWGKGLTSEAASAVVAHGRNWRPQAKIVARTFPDNFASQRVLEKAGFRRNGTRICEAPARDCGQVENAPRFVFEPAEAA